MLSFGLESQVLNCVLHELNYDLESHLLNALILVVTCSIMTLRTLCSVFDLGYHVLNKYDLENLVLFV